MGIGITVALAIGLAATVLATAACGPHSGGAAVQASSRLTEDEKHRLYAAALAVSDSPLDSEVFKGVCQRIEIFDANGRPNDKYIQFVSTHVDWATRAQTEQFRMQINTPQKARQYIDEHLAG